MARRLHLALYPHLLTALDGVRGAGFDEQAQEDGDLLDAALARPLSSSGDLPFDVLAGLADGKTGRWCDLKTWTLSSGS